MNDIEISGSGSMGGGEYNNVRISGSGRVGGGILCKNFSASGSTRVDGSIKCTQLSASGSMHANGSIDCETKLSTSGALEVNGSIKADIARCSGSVAVSENISAREVAISGSSRIGGDVSAEKAVISGAVKIAGLLNAESVEIHIDHGATDCQIGAIGGGTVSVINKGGIFMHGFGRIMRGSMLRTTSIEADTVEIECTAAQTVRAINATIGDNSDIDTVEYSGTLTVSDSATVRNKVKI